MKVFSIAAAAAAVCALTKTLVAADTTGGYPWGYQYNNTEMASPDQWAEHYPTCGGSSQSPIDIDASAGCNSAKRSLTFSGECPDFSLAQSDESFKASVVNGSCTVSANDASYDMAQFHLHTPSEHTLNGQALDGEVHFVHSNADGSALLVVGLFLEKDDAAGTDPWMTMVLDEMDNVSANATEPMSMTSYADLINTNADAHGVFNYEGSLTTPGCDEIVDWWVVKTPITMSSTDYERLVNQLKELHVTDEGMNARPVQALNGRVVSSFN